MYAYLGIVDWSNAQKGIMEPSYAVYVWRERFSLQPVRESENRFLALVTHFNDADAAKIIEVAAETWCRKKAKPKGLLLWFECDSYGIPLGPALLVGLLPDWFSSGGTLPADSWGWDLEPYADQFGETQKPIVEQHKKGRKNGNWSSVIPLKPSEMYRVVD